MVTCAILACKNCTCNRSFKCYHLFMLETLSDAFFIRSTVHSTIKYTFKRLFKTIDDFPLRDYSWKYGILVTFRPICECNGRFEWDGGCCGQPEIPESWADVTRCSTRPAPTRSTSAAIISGSGQRIFRRKGKIATRQIALDYDESARTEMTETGCRERDTSPTRQTDNNEIRLYGR